MWWGRLLEIRYLFSAWWVWLPFRKGGPGDGWRASRKAGGALVEADSLGRGPAHCQGTLGAPPGRWAVGSPGWSRKLNSAAGSQQHVPGSGHWSGGQCCVVFWSFPSLSDFDHTHKHTHERPVTRSKKINQCQLQCRRPQGWEKRDCGVITVGVGRCLGSPVQEPSRGLPAPLPLCWAVRTRLADWLSAGRVLSSGGPPHSQEAAISSAVTSPHSSFYFFQLWSQPVSFMTFYFFVVLNVKKNANRLVSSYKLFMWSLAFHLNTTFMPFRNIFKLSISQFINHNQWNWKKNTHHSWSQNI